MPNNILDSFQISGSVYDLKDKNSPSITELTQQEYDNLPSSAKTSNTLFLITDATPIDVSNYWTSAQTQSAITAAVSGKQDTLVSGTNIKTINNESILGSGNIDIQGGGGSTYQAGRGIDITNDTISFNLSISSSTLASDSIVGGYFGNKSMSQYGFAYGDNAKCDNGGAASIALGRNVTANGGAAIALGSDNTAKGKSVAIGRYINTNIEGEIGVGIYNISSSGSSTFGDSGNTLFSVGNGTSNSARHNAFEIRQNGDIYISKDGQDVKLQDQLGGGAASSAITSGDTNAVAGGAVYDKFDEVEQVTAAALNVLNDKFGGLKLQQTSQSDYDALVSGGTVDSSTLYIITNVVS